MAYREMVQQLGERTAAKVLAAYTEWAAGRLTDAAFSAALVAVIASARLRAAALADLGLSATLSARLGRYVPPQDSRLDPDTDRLTKAADTLVTELPDTADQEARVRRLGLAETVAAAIVAYSAGIRRRSTAASSPRIVGWTRGISASACQLCTWWAKDGATFPPEIEMAHHPGCTCTQLIITK